MSCDRHPASPLARWLLSITDHIENTSRDRYLLLWRDVSACASYADTKKTLLLYCWPRACCVRCLPMDLHVTILFYHLRLHLPSVLFPCGFPTKIPMRTTCHAHLILHDSIILIILGEQYKLRSPSLCGFLQPALTSCTVPIH
jgi:hypothetical protein